MPGLRERDTNAATAVAAAKRPSLEEMAPRAGGQAGAVAHAAAKAHAAGGVEQLRMQWGAGAFRHVHLENFMCHEHFEVRTQRRASERASERETERQRATRPGIAWPSVCSVSASACRSPAGRSLRLCRCARNPCRWCLRPALRAAPQFEGALR